jgi:hypothetical protein
MGIEEKHLTDEPDRTEPDYTLPIARTGEQQFGCILRQRSGVSAGEIDFALRDCTVLSDADQQDACDCAYMMYESICRQTGKQSSKDRSKQ